MPVPVPYLEIDGNEIANANRTLIYVARLLGDKGFDIGFTGKAGDPFDPQNLACFCEVTSDTDYQSPASDPAPWYDSAEPASGEFLGLFASSIVPSPIAKRAVTDRSTGGVVGALRALPRTIAVTGTMYATSARGMVFGEDWLQQQLAGASVGCSDDVLTLLRSCDEANFADLHEVGLVDGPVFTPVGSIPDCNMEQVFFQVVAGWPYYISNSQVITNPTALTSGIANRVCGHITGAFGRVTAGKLIIVAGTSNVTGLEIFGEPCAGYTDTYADLYDPYLLGSGTVVDLLVGTLPAGSTFVFDGTTHTATLTDSGGRTIGGLDVLTPSPGCPFQWPEVQDGAIMCLCVAAGTVNAGTTVSVESADRSL
jgi:hypothetical protein